MSHLENDSFFFFRFNYLRWITSNSKLSVTSVKYKIVTTSLSSTYDMGLLNLLAVRNDWQGDRHASLWSLKSAVMSEVQSTLTAQAWPLDLQDITGASEHVSIGGWRLRVCFGREDGGWCEGTVSLRSWGWGGGWLEKVASLGDLQRSSCAGGY